MDKNRPIGVFDSGMGGLSVLGNLIEYFPDEKFIYFGDSKNAPYGIKGTEKVKALSIAACDFLVNQGVKAIVIACNTATSAAIKELRRHYKIPIIGVEPALKPAVEQWENGKIAVMATPLTLNEKKFNALRDKVSGEIEVMKIPCPELVELVEMGITQGDKVRLQLTESFKAVDKNELDSIVLGCTHYLFLYDEIRALFGNVKIYHGNVGTVKQVERLLRKSGTLQDCSREKPEETRWTIYSSDEKEETLRIMAELLNKYLNL